jgi:hypothetical protein
MLIYDQMKMMMLLYLHMFMCSEHDKIHNLSLIRGLSNYLPSPVVDELVMLVVKFTFHIKECKPRLVVY